MTSAQNVMLFNQTGRHIQRFVEPENIAVIVVQSSLGRTFLPDYSLLLNMMKGNEFCCYGCIVQEGQFRNT